MKRRPTILDVAEAAGVSKSTVSLVLQGSDLVRDETARTVREAMAAVGYVYNRAAANLRSASTGLVGLVINDLRNPFFTELATTMQMRLADAGFATVIGNADEDPLRQEQLVRSMLEHGVAGLVISPSFGDPGSVTDQILTAGVPAMQLLRRLEGSEGRLPFASFDYTDGGRLATRHLLDQGLRRIAFVGGAPGRQITKERASGYLEQMHAAGLTPLTLHGPTSRRSGFDSAAELPPETEAVLCFNDLVALGLMNGLAHAGRRVGQDIRLVGFDDIAECAEVWPALSSVSCDIARFGDDMARRLLSWLDTGAAPPNETRAPVGLVVRQSSLGGNHE
ncbi:LacI family DNA-binding transcriptional regulator [Paracoccus aerodenitrificans]|uniref:LacI family DNA-binding transcriptional regulator n=1 Tax=Paracoccus aerodenitrificans TaxID=3017781 RepID=UPI0022F0B0ED|nr:LacI family DNA-binding transcriptional regulator [Paracoccus aerodenitrificans]WBU65301.1 LacI family DNA-binding transcriptional regulator [Paracoccus aerodenitrificans]